ncbi:hypothetical protein J8M14_21285 [Aquimarina sp. MMG016]|nr:hypothetical protein [Aquimarina sp. MMG016]
MSILLIIFFALKSFGQTRTIHVYVALCDNKFQGIVPVPEKIGNGQDPENNLYWGAGYGVKTFFKKKAKDWKFIKNVASDTSYVLDRLLFKHVTEDIYMLAEAYDGEYIQTCTEDFLKASNGQNSITLKHNETSLFFGGGSNLISYVGHDGLMDFDVDISYNSNPKGKRDIMILACYSKNFFMSEIQDAKANPLLWTTHLMAPEAYTLDSAITVWIMNGTGDDIEEHAARTYHKYQNCGIRGARNLFTTGF